MIGVLKCGSGIVGMGGVGGRVCGDGMLGCRGDRGILVCWEGGGEWVNLFR